MRSRGQWKTIYVQSGDEYRDLQSVWQSCGEQHIYEMRFSGGIVETNVPVRLIRSILRTANVTVRDWSTSKSPGEEETP